MFAYCEHGSVDPLILSILKHPVPYLLTPFKEVTVAMVYKLLDRSQSQ